MSYINKAVVNGQEVQLNALEGLQDAQGHNRFVEGNITPTPHSGWTYDYAKWSLSGSHLMIVVACSLDNASLSVDAQIANIELPSWILNKIYPDSNNNVEIKDFLLFQQYGNTGDPVRLRLVKGAYFEITSKTAISNKTGYLRIQFDLLIDNASA